MPLTKFRTRRVLSQFDRAERQLRTLAQAGTEESATLHTRAATTEGKAIERAAAKADRRHAKADAIRSEAHRAGRAAEALTAITGGVRG